MSEPYKQMEFTASSGNSCRLKLFPPSERLAVNVTWSKRPSDADIAECNAWFPAAAEALLGRPIVAGVSARIDDPDLREAVCAGIASPTPHPERN